MVDASCSRRERSSNPNRVCTGRQRHWRSLEAIAPSTWAVTCHMMPIIEETMASMKTTSPAADRIASAAARENPKVAMSFSIVSANASDGLDGLPLPSPPPPVSRYVHIHDKHDISHTKSMALPFLGWIIYYTHTHTHRDKSGLLPLVLFLLPHLHLHLHWDGRDHLGDDDVGDGDDLGVVEGGNA
jgi:hypothetical protein